MNIIVNTIMVIFFLMPVLLQAQSQPDPPSLRIMATEPCQIFIDGKESTAFDGANVALIRTNKGIRNIQCKSQDGSISKTSVNAKENTDTYVYLEFGYMDRFAKVEDVIMDAWTTDLWLPMISNKKYTFKEAEAYCQSYESKIYAEWSVPSLQQLDDLLALTEKNINSCGKEKCSLHPLFKVEEPEVWTFYGNVFNFITRDFYPVVRNGTEIKKPVICVSRLKLREPLTPEVVL